MLKKCIYIAHSRKFNYKDELYKPLRSCVLNEKFEIILPHEFQDTPYSSLDFFQKKCNLLIAECSWPSTGLGIELGWASASNVPIIALFRNDHKVSSSVKTVTNNIIVYENSNELHLKLESLVTFLLG